MRRTRASLTLLGALAAPVLVGIAVGALQHPRAAADEQTPATFDNGVRLAPVPRKDVPATTDVVHLYLRDCATCHGRNARGTAAGPSLVGEGRAGTFYWVSTGRMPLRDPGQRIGRRAPAYPPDIVNRLVDYVAELAGGGGPNLPALRPANVADGLELFGLECASCHAWSGSGSIIVDGKVPTVTPATPEQVAAAVRIGPGEMPAFGRAAFDDQQLSDVVAYVGTLQRKDDAGGWGLFHRGPTTEGAAALVLGLGAALATIGWIGTKARSYERD